MSVAIVAMVNHTAIRNPEEVIEVVNDCGVLITNETDAAERVSTRNSVALSLRKCKSWKGAQKCVSSVFAERRWTI